MLLVGLVAVRISHGGWVPSALVEMIACVAHGILLIPVVGMLRWGVLTGVLRIAVGIVWAVDESALSASGVLLVPTAVT